MSSGVQRVFTGAFVGTGADKVIKTPGFRPRKVVLFNTSGICKGEWQDSMADASMFKTVDSGTGTTDITFVTANGITPNAEGFTLGADTDLNVVGETVHYEATQ